MDERDGMSWMMETSASRKPFHSRKMNASFSSLERRCCPLRPVATIEQRVNPILSILCIHANSSISTNRVRARVGRN